MYCSICMSTNNRLPTKIYCKNGHIFHTSCMKEWHSLHNECPVCRETILTSVSGYNLRSRKIRDDQWDIKGIKFKDLNQIPEYIEIFIREFNNGPIENRFFKLYNLYKTFILNWEMISNEVIVFESIRSTIIYNTIVTLQAYENNNIEYTKANEILDKFRELKLDYVIIQN